jgi:hypothetical protein
VFFLLVSANVSKENSDIISSAVRELLHAMLMEIVMNSVSDREREREREMLWMSLPCHQLPLSFAYICLTATQTFACKRKAIPLQALTGPEGSRRLRLTDFKTIGT